MTERVLVIGGDAGGMAAVRQVRKGRRDIEIVALERGSWTSYSACGIPFAVGGQVNSVERLQVRPAQAFRDRDRIDVRLRHEAMSIDTERRTVEVRALDQGRTYQLGFDQLLIGTGGTPIRPPLPGIDLPQVLEAQTLEHAKALVARIDRGDLSGPTPLRRVVIVGGGYISIEMAEAFAARGIVSTLVTAGEQLMSSFDADMVAPMLTTLAAHRIEVRTGVRVTGFEPDGVITATGKIPADLVVLGLGIAPNSALAEAAGIHLGVRDAISVDPRQQTSVEGVFAAGDCCESFHLVSRQKVHMALGTVANKQSRVAGINIGGGYATFPGVVGTAISKICALEVSRTGLSVAEARSAGLRAVEARIESTTRADYYPDAAPITVKIVAECGSARLLGAQIVGGPGSGKRIDAVAVALTAGLDAEALMNADLAYAPPFSPVWDPVQVAAREVLKLT